MYYIRIKSTFKEYCVDVSHLSDTINDAKEWCNAVLMDIYTNTVNNIQKKFASYLIDDIKKDIYPMGYGGCNGYIAIDFLEETEFERHKINRIIELKEKIKSLKSIVGEE